MNPEVFQAILPHWLLAFGFSLAVEVPLFVIIGLWLAGREKRAPIWKLSIAGAVGTVITHPLLWFVWPLVMHNYTAYIISGELIVATVETFIFYIIARPIRLTHAFAAAFIANGFSYGLGLFL
jgi:hypothetical protein